MDIVIYTTDGCQKCRVLKQKMDDKSISYTESKSVDQIIDKMLSMGIQQAPVLSVNGELFAFSQANEWVNNQ